MGDRSQQLKERTMSFATAILRLIDEFPRNAGGEVVARQLAKSATSIGANYRAACTARSRAEFISKLCTVNEEADETVCWLDIALRAKYGSEARMLEWRQESI